MPKPKRIALYKIIRRELSPMLEAMGLREVIGGFWGHSLLEYKRTDNPDDIVGLWFQRDAKAFYVDVYGSKFTVEFVRSVELKDRLRMSYLLSAEQLETMREIENRVIRRLPTTEVKTDDEPYPPGRDRWMGFRDEEDLLGWTAYLKEVLPGTLAKFAAAFPPVPER